MALNATLRQTNIVKAVVRPDGTGRLVGTAPITLKNQFGQTGAQYIADLKDVNIAGLTDGATLLYNASTEKYDVRQLTDVDISDIDLGTF